MRNHPSHHRYGGFRLLGLFLGLVVFSIFAFFVLGGLLGARGGEDGLLIGMVISLQLSLLTAYVILKVK